MGCCHTDKKDVAKGLPSYRQERKMRLKTLV